MVYAWPLHEFNCYSAQDVGTITELISVSRLHACIPQDMIWQSFDTISDSSQNSDRQRISQASADPLFQYNELLCY
jgi:hypothetical protein